MRRTLIAISILALVGCSHPAPTTTPTSLTIYGNEGPVKVTLWVADTEAERERGLMGKPSLAPDRGMLFLFADKGGPVTTQFWMKDTLVPLSIAFWNADGRIVAIRDMVPCTADPCAVYGAPVPYIGALEVNEGFFKAHGVVVGDRVALG